MKIRDLHRWDLSPTEAMALQRDLRQQVVIAPCDITGVRYVAGADISFDRGSDRVFAAVVVMRWPDLRVVEEATVEDLARFPYIPGLLSFRESPPLLKACEKLRLVPDVIVLDGQGLAHPRRMGIACHVGLLLDIPAVGCAKSVLVGSFQEPPPTAGSYTPLVDRGEVVGVALRTKDHTHPVFVSPGHKMDLESAIAVILRCTAGYRQPEPTRQAHLLVNRLRQGRTATPDQGSLF